LTVPSRRQQLGGRRVEGFDVGPVPDTPSNLAVEPAFCQTLGVPLLAGREFTRAGTEEAPRVSIVNDAFARKFGPRPRRAWQAHVRQFDSVAGISELRDE